MLHIMTRQFSIVREPDMGHRWRLASCRVCFRSGAGAWEGLARALVFLGQMFQRGGGVQPAARPSFKCSFFLAVATSIPPRMFDVGRRQIAARRLRVVFSRPDQNQAVSK